MTTKRIFHFLLAHLIMPLCAMEFDMVAYRKQQEQHPMPRSTYQIPHLPVPPVSLAPPVPDDDDGLDLADQGITEMETVLDVLTENLQRLNLNNNSLTHLDVTAILQRSPLLRTLSARENHITTVNFPLTLPDRVTIDLSNNQLQRIPPFQVGSANIIRLRNNPLDAYTKKMLQRASIPSLSQKLSPLYHFCGDHQKYVFGALLFTLAWVGLWDLTAEKPDPYTAQAVRYVQHHPLEGVAACTAVYSLGWLGLAYFYWLEKAHQGEFDFDRHYGLTQYRYKPSHIYFE